MIQLYNEDCLYRMKQIKEKSIDLLLVDLPYGTTNCKWDIVLPFEELWQEYNRIVKNNGAMLFTATQPFTSLLIGSNLKNYKYNLVWEKSKATGYLNAKKQPMRAHEDICVFYRKPPTYNPIMTQGDPYYKGSAHRPTDVYGQQKEVLVENKSGLRYPRSVQYFKTAESEGKVVHPTQKPVSLMEYLIKSYSNEEDTVLDNCMGSGTTGVACIRTNRNFIGIEKDPEYFAIAKERMEDETNKTKQKNS